MTNATATFEESLKVVTSVESRRDFATYVPRDGVSLNFLLKHLPSAKLHTRKKKRSKPIKTMYDLEAYVLELTSKWHCSFTELMKEHPEHKDSVVDTATYFVSFAYSTDVETILSALEKYRRKLRADDIFVWISILSINQHFGRKKGEKAAVVYPKSWFKQAFKECIPAIKNVLFVMSPLGKPVALQRLWCIYELYLSVSNQICSLDVILSEEDEQYLIDNLLINSQSVLTYINGVNAEKATSSNREQEQKLRKQIAEIPGGYAAIDEAVRKRLREWFAHAATGYIAEKKEDYRGDRTKYIRLLRTVTKMLLEAGRLDSALSLAKEDLEECKAFYGNEHEETTMAMNNLAMVLVNMGKLEESIRLKEESLRIEKKVLGSDHPQYAYGLNNLGMLLRDQGKVEEAEPMLREALRITKKVFGKNHRKVAAILNNLAGLLKGQGRYDEAKPMYEKSLRIRRKALGDEHPAVAESLNNLAQLLKAQGKLDEATPLSEESLRIRRKAQGNEHPAVAVALNNLAQLLRAKGEYAEAEKLQKEAVEIRKRQNDSRG